MQMPNASNVNRLKNLYYYDETNIVAAKQYASELYSYYLEEDDSEHMLLIVKRELENLHFAFPSDEEIAEYLASCISIWACGKEKSSLAKAKKELLIVRTNFPNNEDIAEYYSDVLVLLSRKELSKDKCEAYFREMCRLKDKFSKNTSIINNFAELKEKIDNINNYWDSYRKSEKRKEQYIINPSLSTAKMFAESLCKLTSYEISEEKSEEYVKTITSLVSDYPISIELIEFQASAIYYTAKLQGYDAMRKASGIIQRMLNKYPSDERLAEIYTQTLDYLCEDEDNLEMLVRKIEKYYLLYPDNLSITTSYATVLSVIIEEQSAVKREETLNLLWDLFLLHSDEEFYHLYKDAFNRFQYVKDEELNQKVFYLHNYSVILEQSVIKYNTGKVVEKYKTLIEACQKNRMTPLEMLSLIGENQNSEYKWAISEE